MMSGQPPFRAVNDYHLFTKIQQLDFSFPPGIPPIVLDLVQKLLPNSPIDETLLAGLARRPCGRTEKREE
ncbi:hypothetical protein DXG03_000969 [Asterophora parasitica]|uniref:Protein kinase domain-containing protein n=1 Tax=Asterophora parasitica TaxID=117018 RepID=A0A9P7G3G1_9AGAR|nr:hypothetical protein DXG03_000969 [Asterophora parasitica]